MTKIVEKKLNSHHLTYLGVTDGVPQLMWKVQASVMFMSTVHMFTDALKDNSKPLILVNSSSSFQNTPASSSNGEIIAHTLKVLRLRVFELEVKTLGHGGNKDVHFSPS